jgi:hypothetical protein
MSSERNAIKEILETPDNLDVEGAREVKLTDASEFIRALPHDPNVPHPEVYEYRTTILPENERIPMHRVMDLAISLYDDFDATSAIEETRSKDLDGIRLWLMEKNPHYKEFFKKCPKLFRSIVSGNSEKFRKHIMLMISEKWTHMEMNLPRKESDARIAPYMRQHFMRRALPGEEEAAVAAGTGFSGTPMTRDEVRQEIIKNK